MERRRFIYGIALGIVVVPPTAKAQQPPTKTARIGYLSSNSAAGGKTYLDAFLKGLEDLGYVEGRNLTVDYRWADSNFDRLPALAKELAELRVDVLASGGGPLAARAAKAATTTIPVIFVSGAAIASGIVPSMARPGGNVTGLELLAEDLDGKRLELLKQMVPNTKQVAVLWNPGSPEGEAFRVRLDGTGQTLGMKLRFFGVRNPAELEGGFQAIARAACDGLLASADPLFLSERARIIRWTAGTRLPAVYFDRIFADSGGLLSYGPDIAAIYRHAATYVDKILRGAKPADLAVEQPKKFEIVLNLRTAKAIGVSIPQSLLLRADEIIR